MDSNPNKKLKIMNSSVRGPLRNVDKSSSEKKFIAELNHDTLVEVLMDVPAPERLEMARGKFFLFINFYFLDIAWT